MSNKRRFRHRLPSPAVVLATIALVAVLGGTATAAGGLINGKKIKKGTVTGKQIKTGSIPVNKLKPAAIKTLKGAKGPKGERGATGAKGDPGPQGPAGIVTPASGKSASVNIADGATTTVLSVPVAKARSYVVNAKVNLFSVQDTSRVECHLTVGGVSADMVQWTSPEANARQAVPLQAVVDVAGAPIELTCGFDGGNGSASEAKIAAIPVG